MLRTILAMFQGEASEPLHPHHVEIAAAALLYEVIKADHDIDQRELEALSDMLQNTFSLTAEETEMVLASGSARSEYAVDLVQFTQVLNQSLDASAKHKVIQGLWHVAYADKTLAPLEEHVIRKIADLLYIPHSQYIQAKLAAQSVG